MAFGRAGVIWWRALPPFRWLIRAQRADYYKRCARDPQEAARFAERVLPVEFNRPGLKALDFGCGAGRHTALLSQCGWHVTGVDLHPPDPQLWPAHAQFVQGGLETLSKLDSESFDLAAAVLVMEYLPDPPRLLQALRRVVRPGGALWLQCANRDNGYTARTGRLVINEPGLLRYFRRSEVEQMLADGGWSVERVWTERVYFTIFPSFFGFLWEVCLPPSAMTWLERRVPENRRAVINVIARKS